jgi:hypothetical protein
MNDVWRLRNSDGRIVRDSRRAATDAACDILVLLDDEPRLHQ